MTTVARFDLIHITMKDITSYQGKKLQKSQTNLLRWLEEKGIVFATASATRQNPYSGVSVMLDPLAVTLHDWIVGSSRVGLVGTKLVPISKWDTARYLFLHLWPDEYYKLID